MKFVFFTKGDKSVPSSRYRAYYIAEELQVLGHEATVIPVTDYTYGATLHYLQMLRALAPETVVYLQRPVLNRNFVIAAVIARFLGRHFIFDFDDAVYEHSPWQTKLLVRLADFVTCGSEKIQEWALQYNKNSFVLTNSIPLSIYTQRVVEPKGIPVIGWIGTMPEVYMRPVIPALKELAAQGRQFNLRVIGAMGDTKIRDLLNDMPNVTIIDSLNWADPSEAVQEIKLFSIGIMPLSSESWNQVRYFKALEYMACSVPVVASAADTVRAIIEKSGCGIVASNTRDWVASISHLLDDPLSRMEMGERGRATIEEKYSVTVAAQTLLEYISNTKH